MTNLNSNLEALFGKMEGFISTKTVVGEPMEMGDITIIPLVDISFGVGAGSTDTKEEKNNKEGAAGGLGAKITPSAMMVIKNGNVQIVSVNNSSPVSKLFDAVPNIVSEVSNLFKKPDIDENIIPDEERIVE